MKPRHAAALALVGWYLLMPPPSSKYPGSVVDTTAPLSQWEVVPSYDYYFKEDTSHGMTAEQCEQVRLNEQGSAKWHPADKLMAQQANNARCVNLPDDDPHAIQSRLPPAPPSNPSYAPLIDPENRTLRPLN